MNEVILIEEARAGNIDSFNRLVLEYQAKVYNVALRILGDEPAAEDAAQNTFIAAYTKLSSFRGGSFLAWLLRIATNQCYDTLRYSKRHPLVPLEPNSDSEDASIESPSWMTDPSDGPEASLDRRELEKVIQNCLKALPVEYRMVAVLIDVQGLDYDTASEIIKVPLGTVKSRLARARMRLQTCLKAAWELLPPSIRLSMESER